MNEFLKTKKGITLVALVVTVIILLILAGISISTLTNSGLFERVREAEEKSEKGSIEEEIKIAIMEIYMDEISKGSIALEKLANGLLANKLKGITVTVVDNKIQGEYKGYYYEIDSSFNVTVLDAISGIIFSYELIPEEGYTEAGYTNGNIKLTIDVRSTNGEITKREEPENITKNEDGIYLITANGEYTFKVEDETGATKTKTIKIDKIDKLAPKDFTISVSENSITGRGFTITGNAQDAIDETGANATSGIARYEYYVNGTKYDKNEITGLEKETTYTVYGVAYDKAGNASNQTASLTVTTTKDIITVTASEIAANPKEYYGKKVENYKASSSDTNIYRIFYVDTDGEFGEANTIYLKADFFGGVRLSRSMPSTPTTQSIEMVKILNPDWAEDRGSLSSSWNENEKAAAYLCDPEIATWKNACYNEKYANYVIGGPSVEMYVKSYNQAFNGVSGTYTLGASYRETSAPGYIYTLNGKQCTISNSDYYTGDNSLNYTLYNSMYCGKNGSKTGYWWLASPSSYRVAQVCFVYGNYARLYRNDYQESNGVSPLVSLKSDFQVKIEKID